MRKRDIGRKRVRDLEGEGDGERKKEIQRGR